MMTTHRSLVLVVPPSDTHNQLPGLWLLVGTHAWMCDLGPDERWLGQVDVTGTPGNICNPSKAVFGYRADNWKEQGETLYCLAEPFEQDCKLEFIVVFLAIVCVANAVKVAAILRLFFVVQERSLITTGDAVASFLRRNDAFATNLCAYDYHHFKGNWGPSEHRLPIPWTKRNHRRQDAASSIRLTTSFLLFIAAICATAVLFGLALHADLDRGTASSAVSTTLTTKNHFAIVGFETLAHATLLSLVLLVNTTQLILAALYFLYNSLFTILLQSTEWNAFSASHHPLRVSKPEGPHQRSTYWLSQSPRYGIPLRLLSGTLHWLVSQAIFFSKIEF